MDVKPCPYCGKQLPSELSFCPYCMHSLAEKKTSPVQRTFAPPWFRYGLGAVLVLCALLSAVWLFPRRTALPAGATPTDTVTGTASGRGETIGISDPMHPFEKGESSSQGPAFWNPSPSSAILPSGIFTPPMDAALSAGFSSSANRPVFVPSTESGSSVPLSQDPPASGVSSEQPVQPPAASSVPSSVPGNSSVASSEGEVLPDLLQKLMERSEKEFVRYLALWNQTAKEIGYGQYAIVDYEINPLAVGGGLIDISSDYSLQLQHIRLAGGCFIDEMRWECSADRSEAGSGCAVRLQYLQMNETNAIPQADISYVNYLALSTFAEHREDDFVKTFYGKDGWEQTIHRNAGIHNGWYYLKQSTYNGFLFEDGYIEYFENLEINQSVIAKYGTNLFRNHVVEFSCWNM